MKTIIALAFTMSPLASGLSVAAAPELHVKKSVTVAAPADKVWDAVKNFNELNTWHPAVASDEIVSTSADVEGRRNDQGKATRVRR
jgi:uncharacterized membrane protein